jgi:outer membrane protein OmpA-like peptidoglycan-associated protein
MDFGRATSASVAGVSLAVCLCTVGCNQEKKRHEQSLTEITQSYDRLQPRLTALKTALGNLRRDVEDLAATAPGGAEWRSKYFAADEVLGVLDAKMKWLSAEIASARKDLGRDQVSFLREAMAATAGELGQADKVAVELLHEKVRLQWLASLLKAPYQHELPTGFAIKAAKDGVESHLIDSIERPGKANLGRELELDRLAFVDGTDELDLRASRSQLENVAQVLKAYPAVKLKIAAYADAKSAAQGKKQAAKVAGTVRMALVQSGVASERLTAEGYRATPPGCGNGAARECDSHGRRITAVVTAR